MTKWTGAWNNWIAPFHVCPRCGASLDWSQHADAIGRPSHIIAACCGVRFSAAIGPAPEGPADCDPNGEPCTVCGRCNAKALRIAHMLIESVQAAGRASSGGPE
jgi:hypothetical protein